MELKMSLFHCHTHVHNVQVRKSNLGCCKICVRSAAAWTASARKELSGYKFPSFFLDKNFV